jgi:RNA-binding protein
MTTLTGLQKRHLRGLSHHLKALVQVGKNGLTDGVVEAVAQALDAHELIKVRVAESAEGRKALAVDLAERTASLWVGTVGHVVTLYRRHEDPEKQKIELPLPSGSRSESEGEADDG